MEIKAMVKESHARAVEHGWWSTPEDQNISTKIALIHSEVSEAFEEYRHGRMETYFDGSFPTDREAWYEWAKTHKPEGFDVELADAMIRIFDLAGALGIDLETAITLKSIYNEGRPFRHGGLAV